MTIIIVLQQIINVIQQLIYLKQYGILKVHPFYPVSKVSH